MNPLFATLVFLAIALYLWLYSKKRRIALWQAPLLTLAGAGLFSFFEWMHLDLARLTIDLASPTGETLYAKGDFVKITSLTDPQIAQFLEPLGFMEWLPLAGKIGLMALALALLFALLLTQGQLLSKKPLRGIAGSLIVWSLLGLVCHSIQFYSAPLLLAIALLWSLAGFLRNKECFKFLSNKIELSKLEIIILAATLSFFALSLAQSWRPLPMGFDESSYYEVLVQRLAANIKLQSTGPFAWSSLESLLYRLWPSTLLRSLFLQLALLLAFLSSAKLFKAYGKTMAWGLSLALLTLPFLIFQETQDLKTEIPLLAFGLLTLLTLTEALKSKSKTDLLWLGLLLGATFSIKATGLLLLPPIALFIAWRFKFKAWPALLGFAVTALPWALFLIWKSDSFSLYTPFLGSYDGSIQWKPEDYCELSDQAAQHDVDLTRYKSNAWWLLSFKSPFTSISLLGPAALTLLTLRSKEILRSKTLQLLLLGLATYLLTWFASMPIIIWYGLFVTVAVAALFAESQHGASKHVQAFALLLLFSILGHQLYLRASYQSPAQPLLHGAGQLSQEELVDYVYPGYPELTELLQQDDTLIYQIGSFINHFLVREENNFVKDNDLRFWRCVSQASTEIQEEFFHSKGITHILIHTGADKDAQDELYQAWFTELLNFLPQSRFTKLYDEHGLILYQVAE